MGNSPFQNIATGTGLWTVWLDFDSKIGEWRNIEKRAVVI